MKGLSFNDDEPCKVISELNLCQRGQPDCNLNLNVFYWWKIVTNLNVLDRKYRLHPIMTLDSPYCNRANQGRRKHFFQRKQGNVWLRAKKTMVSGSFIGQEIKHRVLVLLLTSGFILWPTTNPLVFLHVDFWPHNNLIYIRILHNARFWEKVRRQIFIYRIV